MGSVRPARIVGPLPFLRSRPRIRVIGAAPATTLSEFIDPTLFTIVFSSIVQNGYQLGHVLLASAIGAALAFVAPAVGSERHWQVLIPGCGSVATVSGVVLVFRLSPWDADRNTILNRGEM